MTSYTLSVQDSTHAEEFPGVTSFVGVDPSGSFGILAGHARFMTVLGVGLARFRSAEGAWRYLALPGAVAYFYGDRLTLSTRRYLVGDDYTEISAALAGQLVTEEQELHAVKESLHRMEEQILTRLWNVERGAS
jgi:F-type H+-transporting ATPase subunit epsilon